MKVNKDIRQVARHLVRASFADGALDRKKVQKIFGEIAKKKPRHYLQLLETYQRLLRLEAEKHRAQIESATPLDQATGHQIAADLKRKYGKGLTTEFSVNAALLGGVRIRVGSDVWDSSVRNRLERLQQKL
ncbi:MAG TPA: F0F1 ATP synthase subunit delta [Chthoniobacterales bacterium]